MIIKVDIRQREKEHSDSETGIKSSNGKDQFVMDTFRAISKSFY